MKRQGRRAVSILALALASTFVVGPSGSGSAAPRSPTGWKGAETFSPVAVGPNLTRCGPFPRNVEARFSGLGVDTNGGPYSVLASGCLDTEADVVFDLEATDTYVGTGDAVFIAPDDAPLVVDAETCVATNARPVWFEVTGGTGRFAGATGGGRYTLVMTMPDCPGPQVPIHVWFEGHLEPAG